MSERVASGLGAMMAGGNPAVDRGRQENDFYGTPVEVTEALLRSGFVLDDAWEPCAGKGDMGDALTRAGFHTLMTDIAPQRADIITADFFDYAAMPEGFDTIVTNPPFSMASAFIEHAFVIGCQRMALVLKATYWHALTLQALFHRYRPSRIMPLTWRPDFLQLGRPTMEVMWCVWDQPCALSTSYEPLSKKDHA